ncbi:GNVR domain-containing protein [Altererythrobacter arenosus]|uniref:non-specific protein-tyrosine kinase n=1 Tax=Altererythrobacter arenosus TaxID=3032592 RepID=A0ABY8FLR4_9SPHN|nr:GNVR domain-containing protein [Altererythrobacter sp. CAU 1644]WFL75960.1 GNVR domain-containing protein [Altererythrobacter sp. CAU 1644]
MSGSRELVRSNNHGTGTAVAHYGERSLVPSDQMDLSGSLSFFRRQLKLILIVTGLALLGGLALSLLVGKTYLAESTVMLTNDAAIVTQSTTATSPQTALSAEVVDTQMEVITSQEMANRVAGALGLTNGVDAGERRKVLDELQENVSARRAGESYALTIAYQAEEPEDAAKIANEFTRQYVNWDVAEERQRNEDARKIVAQRLAELRDQAQADTQALQQYRIQHNLLSTSGASLTEQEISSYNQEVTNARAAAAEDQARLRTALAQLRSGSVGDDVGEALGSPVINSLRSQEALAATAVADLSAKYGPNHPQLIRAQSQLDEVRRRIEAEIGRVISNLRAKQEVSAQRLASLNSSLSSARAKLSQNNDAMVGLSEVERAAEASQGIYETYLNRYKELIAAEGSEKANAQILTLAQTPILPHSPNIPLNLALALVIGLGLGILAAYIREALFNGVLTPDEIEREFGMPCLASIPLLSSVDTAGEHPATAIQDAPKSPFAEAFRSLGASIDLASYGQAKVIAVTSALPNEGKTVMSCCLASVLAAGGQKTMLIDCDLRRQGISRLLNMQAGQKGLIDVLNGSAPIDFEQYVGDNVFCVLPLSPSKEEPEHLLRGDEFVELLENLRGHFDRIILDLPPILPIAATRILASRADAVVMAAKWRETSRFAIRAALRRLPPDQVNVAGMVLSGVDMKRRSFLDPHDPYFYYSQYKEYYA